MAATTTKRHQRKKSKERGSLIKKYGIFLDGLTRSRQKMVNVAPKNVIDYVGECCLNYIKGNVHLTNAQKKKIPSSETRHTFTEFKTSETTREKENHQSKRRNSSRFIVETFTWSNHRVCSWLFSTSTASTISLWKGVRWLSYHLNFEKI